MKNTSSSGALSLANVYITYTTNVMLHLITNANHDDTLAMQILYEKQENGTFIPGRDSMEKAKKQK